MHDQPRRDVVLLTGASTGLGLAIARVLLPTDYHLILTARQSSLPRFAEEGIFESERVWIRGLDVTRRDDRRAVVSEAESRLGGIDCLINNAGFSLRAVMEHVTESDSLEQMAVNFRAPVELIRLVLPLMRVKRRGKIINISSVGGMMAMPTMGMYSASKFALEGASESLWYEVRPWGISVTLIQPGFINSASFQRVKYTFLSREVDRAPPDPYHEHYVSMEPFIARLMRRAPGTPDGVARVVLNVMRMKEPPLRVGGTPDATVFSLLRRLLPRSIYHRMLYWCLPAVRTWGRGDGRKLLPLSAFSAEDVLAFGDAGGEQPRRKSRHGG